MTFSFGAAKRWRINSKSEFAFRSCAADAQLTQICATLAMMTQRLLRATVYVDSIFQFVQFWIEIWCARARASFERSHIRVVVNASSRLVDAIENNLQCCIGCKVQTGWKLENCVVRLRSNWMILNKKFTAKVLIPFHRIERTELPVLEDISRDDTHLPLRFSMTRNPWGLPPLLLTTQRTLAAIFGLFNLWLKQCNKSRLKRRSEVDWTSVRIGIWRRMIDWTASNEDSMHRCTKNVLSFLRRMH